MVLPTYSQIIKSEDIYNRDDDRHSETGRKE